jgi:hypothetical protein
MPTAARHAPGLHTQPTRRCSPRRHASSRTWSKESGWAGDGSAGSEAAIGSGVAISSGAAVAKWCGVMGSRLYGCRCGQCTGAGTGAFEFSAPAIVRQNRCHAPRLALSKACASRCFPPTHACVGANKASHHAYASPTLNAHLRRCEHRSVRSQHQKVEDAALRARPPCVRAKQPQQRRAIFVGEAGQAGVRPRLDGLHVGLDGLWVGV